MKATLPGPALEVPKVGGFVCKGTWTWAKGDQPLTHRAPVTEGERPTPSLPSLC